MHQEGLMRWEKMHLCNVFARWLKPYSVWYRMMDNTCFRDFRTGLDIHGFGFLSTAIITMMVSLHQCFLCYIVAGWKTLVTGYILQIYYVYIYNHFCICFYYISISRFHCFGYVVLFYHCYLIDIHMDSKGHVLCYITLHISLSHTITNMKLFL